MNKAEKNFFFVNRELLNSDRWLVEKFTRAQAWVDLFGLAQHTDSYFYIRGIRIDVKRGQLAYSQLSLSKRWKWSRNKVRHFLRELENNQDIALETNHQNIDLTTLITIVKYDLWQGKKTPDDTPEGHQKDTKRITYNKDNKDNNENKNTNTGGQSPPTPQETTLKFFEMNTNKGGDYEEFISKMIISTKLPKEKIVEELKKFTEYWTELNSTGTKQRWQKEKVFEVKRRLTTWLNNNNKWSSNNTKQKIAWI